MNPAPKDIGVLEAWAKFFGLEDGEKLGFLDAAALSRRELPADIASDEKVLATLPAFFRAVRGAELDDAQLKQFIEDVRGLHSSDGKSSK